MMRCLDCHTELTGKYCPQCGQKASTRRFSLKYLFTVDFFHGIFHVNKGLLYTLKALFTRPGHSIREYVQGKRSRYFNYFTLIFTVLAAYIIILQLLPPVSVEAVDDQSKEFVAIAEVITKEYLKLLITILVPFFALFSFLFFKKGKQNYAEHLVMNTYAVSAIVIIEMAFMVIMPFNNYVAMLSIFSTIAYQVWFYYQYFSPFYRKKVWLFFRSLLATISINVCYYLMLGVTLYIIAAAA
jgi:hypothetical protein